MSDHNNTQYIYFIKDMTNKMNPLSNMASTIFNMDFDNNFKLIIWGF